MAEATVLRPEGHRVRIEAEGAWRLRVTSYRLGDEFICHVDNVDPGATLCRTSGPTREEAERVALAKARNMVAGTKVVPMEGHRPPA